MTAASDNSTFVLITGANRGLGRALTARFLLQPNTTIVAAVRDLEQNSVSELPHAADSKLVVVKIDSRSDTDAQDAVKLVQAEFGIHRLDVVVANAGYGTMYGDLSQVKPHEVRDLVDINTIGPLRLFQAVRPLLEAGRRPRFVLIGTPIASISAMEDSPFPMFAYGASKVAAHYLTRKIHCESPELIAFVADPGFMQTDMGNTGARHFGYEQAPVPVENSVNFIFSQINNATREQTSGKFVTIEESREFNAW
ncbi:hypothetical protein F4819DRAFT_492172 [Hypoxylon fuscum]|nr:hypothetical protein F4819DRAFT_492172 [Hypoxylon fuscum]